MSIFNKIRGGAGEPGYPPKKKQFTQPGQAFNPDAINSFESPGYKPSRFFGIDKPMAPKNMTFQKGNLGDYKRDSFGDRMPYVAEPKSDFQENDDWLKHVSFGN